MGQKKSLNSLFFDESKYDLSSVGRYRLNKRFKQDVDIKNTVLVNNDLLMLLEHLLLLIHGDESIDDIDHLGNRRIRAVGEQLQKQMRVGLTARLDRLVKEQMALKAGENLVPQNLINIRPLVAVMRGVFW